MVDNISKARNVPSCPHSPAVSLGLIRSHSLPHPLSLGWLCPQGCCPSWLRGFQPNPFLRASPLERGWKGQTRGRPSLPCRAHVPQRAAWPPNPCHKLTSRGASWSKLWRPEMERWEPPICVTPTPSPPPHRVSPRDPLAHGATIPQPHVLESLALGHGGAEPGSSRRELSCPHPCPCPQARPEPGQAQPVAHSPSASTSRCPRSPSRSTRRSRSSSAGAPGRARGTGGTGGISLPCHPRFSHVPPPCPGFGDIPLGLPGVWGLLLPHPGSPGTKVCPISIPVHRQTALVPRASPCIHPLVWESSLGLPSAP